MALLVPDQGEEIILKAFLNITAPQDLVLKLYKNDYTPVDGSDEADFTEADFTGYAHIDLTAGSWVITLDAPSEAAYPQQTFSASGLTDPTQQVYGYYVIQVTSGKLIWAERFTDGPYPMTDVPDAIKVTLAIDVFKEGES